LTVFERHPPGHQEKLISPAIQQNGAKISGKVNLILVNPQAIIRYFECGPAQKELPGLNLPFQLLINTDGSASG
jgi:hypothetical protein